MLAWHLLCLHCHNIDANLTRLIFADWMLHLFAFLMGLLFAFLFSVTDCHDNIMVLAGLLSIVVLCALHFSLFHLSCGWNLVAFRCILSVAFLLILGVAFLLVLSVAFHIRHFSLHILLWKWIKLSVLKLRMYLRRRLCTLPWADTSTWADSGWEMGSNARRRTQLMAIDGLEFSKELRQWWCL